MPGSVNGNLPERAGDFAARLRGLMREQRVGSDRLARESGVDARLIRKYRSGKTAPRDYFGDPTPNAHALARALAVDVAVLLPPVDPEEVAA